MAGISVMEQMSHMQLRGRAWYIVPGLAHWETLPIPHWYWQVLKSLSVSLRHELVMSPRSPPFRSVRPFTPCLPSGWKSLYRLLFNFLPCCRRHVSPQHPVINIVAKHAH